MAWKRVDPGASGEDAFAIQDYLISIGFLSAGARSGVMDPQSVAALKIYQTSIGQVPDGIAWRLVADGTPGSQANHEAKLIGQPPAPTPNPPAPTPPPNPGPPRPTPGMESANAIVRQYLDQWGLGSLGEWAWNKITSGASEAQVLLELRQQEAYKQRFAANVDRAQAGLQQLSETEYLAYERQAAQLMRSAGLPSGFYDQPNDFRQFLRNDVSVAELNQRVQTAARMVEMDQVDPGFADELARRYGIDKGARLAWVLDPERALPLIEKQMAAAQAGTLAQRAGMALTNAEAERVGTLAPSLEQASKLISAVQAQSGVGSPLPTEQGQTIDLIGAVSGVDPGAAQALDRRRRQRVAAFAGEGGFAASNQGVVGLGDAAVTY